VIVIAAMQKEARTEVCDMLLLKAFCTVLFVCLIYVCELRDFTNLTVLCSACLLSRTTHSVLTLECCTQVLCFDVDYGWRV